MKGLGMLFQSTMKRFLPTIPVFLLCFAGGLAMGPKPDHSAAAVAAVAQVPGGLIRGYAAWKDGCKKIEEQEKSMAGTREAISKLEAEGATLEAVQKLLEAAAAELAKQNSELTEIRKAGDDPARAELKNRHQELGSARAKLEQVIGQMAKDPAGRPVEKDFSKRLAWKKSFDAAMGEYQAASKRHAEVLRQIKESASPLAPKGGGQ